MWKIRTQTEIEGNSKCVSANFKNKTVKTYGRQIKYQNYLFNQNYLGNSSFKI